MPTTWLVTGSRPDRQAPYTSTERSHVCSVLDVFLRDGDMLVQGGCVGIDAMALEFAHRRGIHTVTLLPANAKYTASFIVSQCSDEIIETHKGYWQRDLAEVERSDKVLAFPLFERQRSSPMSGSWHTWDLSVSARKHCALMVLRPELGPILMGPEWRTVAVAVDAQMRMF